MLSLFKHSSEALPTTGLDYQNPDKWSARTDNPFGKLFKLLTAKRSSAFGDLFNVVYDVVGLILAISLALSLLVLLLQLTSNERAVALFKKSACWCLCGLILWVSFDVLFKLTFGS